MGRRLFRGVKLSCDSHNEMALLINMNQTAQTTETQPPHDSDGIAPGLDLELTGKNKIIRFSGTFYASPELGEVTLERYVRVHWASKEIAVCIDLESRNMYVVDREKNLSLGCRMNAVLLPL